MYQKAAFWILWMVSTVGLMGQAGDDAWKVVARNIDANHYYGVTLANGVTGIVSSAEALKVKDVVLNGAYDYYQRGRVSNILKASTTSI